MQKLKTICDMCVDHGEMVEASTVDLTAVSAGYEADLCAEHVAELQQDLEQLRAKWIRPARRVVTSPAPSATKEAKRKRTVNKDPRICPECKQTFAGGHALGGHMKAHWYIKKEDKKVARGKQRRRTKA